MNKENETSLNSAANPVVLEPTSSTPFRRNDLFPGLTVIWIATGEIDEAPRRVRRAVKAQGAALKRSIERFGNRVPILVRQKNGHGRYEVIDGHARLAAARMLGAKEMPCLVVDDLPDAEIRRLALSLNRIQEAGAWDTDELRLELGELIAIDDDYEVPGFDVAAIEAILLGDDDETSDPADDTSRAEGPAVTRLGDLWQLGEHLIFCGSARDAAVYDALISGQSVDVVWTDPPYNVKIRGHVRGSGQGFAEFAEASGEMTQIEFNAFLVETLGHAASRLKPGGVIFSCTDWRHITDMVAALVALGLKLINICVWVKTNPGMGSHYRSQHEMVCVARKPGAPHRNNIELGVHGRNRSNVWSYAGATGGKADGDDDFSVHPTVKPLRMVRDSLLDVSVPGELVLDPLLGSGTTLLAAERSRRRCVGIEIEPAYVDLAIRRWQDMTGDQAVHAVTGLPFGAPDGTAESDAEEAACGTAVPTNEAIPPGSNASEDF